MNSSSKEIGRANLKVIRNKLASDSDHKNIVRELNQYKSNTELSLCYLKVALDLVNCKVVNTHQIDWIKKNIKVAIGVLSQGRKP